MNRALKNSDAAHRSAIASFLSSFSRIFFGCALPVHVAQNLNGRVVVFFYQESTYIRVEMVGL